MHTKAFDHAKEQRDHSRSSESKPLHGNEIGPENYPRTVALVSKHRATREWEDKGRLLLKAVNVVVYDRLVLEGGEKEPGSEIHPRGGGVYLLCVLYSKLRNKKKQKEEEAHDVSPFRRPDR